MLGRVLRRGGAALGACLLVVGSFGGAPPASARPAAACTGRSGVTVVVDFGTLGGGVQIRCVTQAVTSGFDALRKAGFTYDPTARFGGLLCRIDGRPADDPCINAPPPDRYWAYWTAAAPGGSWTYSDQGAGNRVPPPGSVEGWAFSDGCDRKPQGGACSSAPTTTTTTSRATTSTIGTRAGGTPGVTTTTTAGARPADEPTGSTDTTGAAAGATSSTAPVDHAPAAGAEGDPATVELDGDQVAADEDAGSAAGVVLGGLVVVGLGSAALITARRRRAHDEAGG